MTSHLPLPLCAQHHSHGSVGGLRHRLLGRHHTAWFALAFGVCVLWGPWSTAGAQPAPYSQVQRLIGAGQLEQARTQADAWLVKQPRDPHMRLLVSVIQSRSQDADAALATLTALTREFPELPEPYNNLAVLHAAAGDLTQARSALEMAIQLNPAYATAHRNLGDLYLQLAQQAFHSAQQHNPGATELADTARAIGTLLQQSPTTP